MTLTSESTPPYLWHKPQKSAETQSFSPLLSNINQGNNDFQYVPVLNTILNSPLEVEPEAYAVFSDGTLTFYYDQNKPAGAYGMRTTLRDQWYDVADKITKVVFDKSFDNYCPTSCAYWFDGCSNLTIIEGMKEFLNTEEVTSMDYMFIGCNSLTSLDVSNFKTEKVTDMSDMFHGCSSLTTLDVSNFNTANVTNTYWMFSYCSSLTSLDVSNFNTDNVTDMHSMFSGCSNLTTLDVSNFKTDNVTDMGYMFNGCSSLTTLDLSNFNTDNVTDMGYMFNGCSSLTTLDLSNFNTDNVTDMDGMFSGCSSLQTIYVGDNWTTKEVTDSRNMFYGCYSLYGGKGTAYNGNIIDATYANIDDPENGKPGYLTKKGEQPYEGLIPYAVFSDGTLTFYYDYGKNKPSGAYGIRGWSDDVSGQITKVVFDKSFADYRPTSCAHWFDGCRNLTKIEGMKEYLNTEEVTSMYYMFNGCSSLTTLDVSNFKTENVTDMYYMFDGCSSLQTIYVGDNWTTKNATESGYMFNDCYSLYGGKGTAYNADFTDATYASIDDPENGKPGYLTKKGEQPYEGLIPYAVFSDGTLTFYYDYGKNKPSGAYGIRGWSHASDQITKVVFDKSFDNYRPTSCDSWFHNCKNLTVIEGMKEYLNTENVTDMGDMFSGCSSLTTLDLSNFKTDNVTSMYFMFHYCSSLTSLDVSNFKTEKVTNMGDMFANCSSLTSLDVSNFKTDNVTNMGDMFNGCSSLQTIYVGDNWTTKNGTYSGYMFNGCTLLVGGKGTAYNADFIDATYARIDGGADAPGYFTKSGEQPVPAFVEGEYRITTGQELLWFANYVNSGHPDANARLMNDIVLNENLLDKVSKGETQDLITWIPIGTPENPYNGYFRTDSCSISGLYVNNPKQDYVGLFGYYKMSAQYISIKDSYFAGHDYVGGIIGYSADDNDYEIGYSYFRGTVSGNNYVGGIVGYTEIAMKNCYVAAKAAGKSNVGAVIGGKKENDKVISHCYYDNTLTTLKAFGFTGADDAENNISGKNSESFHNGEVAYLFGFYQDLSDENSYPEFTGKYVHKNLDGNGYHNPEYEDNHCKYCIRYTYTLPQKVDGVYQISNADELYGFMHLVNTGDHYADAVLTADIVVNENVLEKVHNGNTTGLREWYSIGDNDYWGYHENNCQYGGVFDGNFHTISGLYFDSQIGGNVQCGFISILNGTVRNVIITDSYFHYSLVGGIVCYLMDKEYDEKYGKVINDNTYPAIENCIFDGEIIGEQSAAGICRTFNVNNDGDYIKNCINYGKIIGAGTQSGGILGASWDYGSVVNCYNAGELVCTDESAGDSFGGICGGAALAGISNCYNTGSVSFGYGVYGDHWMRCNITNTYNNSDICKLPLTTTWANNITGGGNLTTAELCNGKLPEGFSDEDWIPGSTETTEDGIVYTFPHLKVFDGQYPAYSIIKDPREPYALLSDNGETVTFYYDKNKPEGAYELQPSYYFNTPWLGGDYETIVFDESFKNYKPTSTATWFLGLFNLKEIKGLENLNTEKVTDMQYMFHSCSNIESLDLSGFDVSNVTNMTGMFTYCYNLHTIFVGDNWNLSDYLPSTNMFAYCYSLYGEQGSMPESYKVYDASMARIDGGDNAPGYFTKKGNSKATVTSIDFSVNPYSEHTLGEPINRQSGILNVYFNNREAQYLPYNHVNITPSGYDSTRVGKQTVTVKLLNATTTYEVNVTAKDTSYAYLDDNGVLTLYYGEYKQGAIFGSKNLLNNPCEVKKVVIDKSFANYHPTTCTEWFQFFNNMTEIKGLENLNTQYVTDMSRMFYSLQTLTTIDVSKLNTENVTSMSEMFTDCQSLTTLDISNFNTEKVSDMSSMFGYCDDLKTIYVGDKWTTKNVTESENMFKYSNNLYGGKGTVYNENFIDATYARIDGGVVAPGYFTLKINNPYTKPEVKDDFYQIGNVEELLWFVFDVNNGDTKANAQLTNDIVVNKDCMERITKLLGISKAADDLTVWQPIGTLNNAYAGIFDGQGHSISGIYINNKNEENVGLFGVTSTDAVIKNLGITDSYIAAKENVGAIVGNNNGIVANCYSTATIESQPNAQNVNGIAGKVSENAVVANSYYLTSEANTNDPQAKTLAEFKSGEVAQLLAEGATINGEKFGGESFAGIVDLPGTENLEELTTPTSELSINSNIRIWSFENTIFVENGCNKIEIVDMAGRIVKQVAPNSNRMEITLPNSGVYIVKTGVKTQKVIVR